VGAKSAVVHGQSMQLYIIFMHVVDYFLCRPQPCSNQQWMGLAASVALSNHACRLRRCCLLTPCQIRCRQQQLALARASILQWHLRMWSTAARAGGWRLLGLRVCVWAGCVRRVLQGVTSQAGCAQPALRTVCFGMRAGCRFASVALNSTRSVGAQLWAQARHCAHMLERSPPQMNRLKSAHLPLGIAHHVVVKVANKSNADA
jgi:hypothetical protein